MDTGAVTQRHVPPHPGHVSRASPPPHYGRDCQEMRLRLQWRDCCRYVDTIDTIDSIDTIDRSEISCGGILVTMAGCHHTVFTVSPRLDGNGPVGSAALNNEDQEYRVLVNQQCSATLRMVFTLTTSHSSEADNITKLHIHEQTG